MLYLAKNGVPWSLAETLDDAALLGFSVALGELDGGDFDWTALKWLEKKDE